MANVMLGRLQGLLKQKKNNKFYAKKLGITEEEIRELREELKEGKTERLLSEHDIDTSKYRVSSIWSKSKGSSVLATLKPETLDPTAFREEFQKFLEGYKPKATLLPAPKSGKSGKVCLIFPKQDAHFNKFDIQGDNSIQERFDKIISTTVEMLEQTVVSNSIEEVVYIIGSDQFNSEWTSETTKGTPQQNILSYPEAFKAICQHEVDTINILLGYSDRVKVFFIPGNHDQYVGWHLVDWLEVYFNQEDRIEFFSNTDNTKYHRYNNTAIMLNHGDAIKPADLACKFPIGFKTEWSLCDHYYIFTGDKHHEKSYDFHGIRFFQVPQLSKAISGWDDKNGYTDSKAEMVVFSISENNGMSKIYKEIL